MKAFFIIIGVFLLLFYCTALSNNITVSNVSVIPVDNNTVDVKFDLSWENSWRTSMPPYNYDAAWVFFKYRKSTGWGNNQWGHAALNPSGHTIPSGYSGTQPSDNRGIFLFRSSNGTGTAALSNIKIRWNINENNLNPIEAVDIKVFAIEMVYIPQASFYVGDGTTTDIRGQFTAHNTSANFFISGEGQMTLGGTTPGNLGNSNSSGMYNDNNDDFNNTTTQTLPGNFPKGYNAFFIMKYEITQQAYVEFLNTLNSQQAANRYPGQNGNFRHRITVNSGNYSTTNPYIACNFLNWADVAAYIDWAALRPMTELEFEKACRGPADAVANECAWGTVNIYQVTGITNPGLNNEVASNNPANVTFGNNGSVQGPMRVGFAGTSSSSRETSGSSFYGVFELSGNVWERPVTVGNTSGRSFTGAHGNGILDANGNADVSFWPGANAVGICFRGGTWINDAINLRISDRMFAAYSVPDRLNRHGGRGIRTAPN